MGFMSSASGQTYTSPFKISLDPQIGTWTTDFAGRTATMNASSNPAPADWYATAYPQSPMYPSYGPTNPMLFSVGSLSGNAVTVASDLQSDRGNNTFSVPINSVPVGVGESTWMQQRVLQAAQQMIGTHYQHLHLPTFDPAHPFNVPGNPGYTFDWNAVSNGATLQSTQQLFNGNLTQVEPNPYQATYGSPQPGIDCTDFAAYVYNIALGTQMHSGTPNQISFVNSGGAPIPLGPGAIPTAPLLSSNGTVITPTFFESPNFGLAGQNAPGSLNGVISQLQPGDLLYMKGALGSIAHVVLWLGAYGTNADGSPSNVPLVISSHDNTPAIFDTQAINANGYPLDGNIDGHLPPPGVQILPFTEENWFYQNFSVAMRVIPVPEPSAGALVVLAACLVAGGALARGRRVGVKSPQS